MKERIRNDGIISQIVSSYLLLSKCYKIVTIYLYLAKTHQK